MDKIINVAVIAHVDAGKSTLVDAILKQTNTFNDREVLEDQIMDSDTRELIGKIYSIGRPKVETWEDKNKSGIYYDNSRSSWTVLYSNHDPMNDEKIKDNKRPLLYRFYLNLRGKEKSDFVLEFINRCQRENIPFQFKFSNDDSRVDQIIVETNLENFEKNFSILEELVSDKKLGEIPMLIGKHDNGIGIAEQYYNRLYTPTTIRLALVRSSIKKLLLEMKQMAYHKISKI